MWIPRDVFLPLSTKTTSLVVLEPPGSKSNNCFIKNDTHYQCKGTLKSYNVYYDNFTFIAAYFCDNETDFDISYEIQFNYEGQPSCEPLILAAKLCATNLSFRDLASKSNFTNVTATNPFGTTDQAASAIFLANAGKAMNSKCHKYIKEFLCYTLFPRCISGQDYPLFPCKEMCDEVMRQACGGEMRAIFDLPNSRDFAFCELCPPKRDQPFCYHPTVHCPMLRRPKHGWLRYNSSGLPIITTKVTLHCKTLYKVSGTNPRICMPSGDWGGNQAFCTQAVPLPVIFGVSGTLVGLILILAIIFAKFNYLIKVFLYVKLNISLGRQRSAGDKTYDAYIMHGYEQFAFVTE